MGNYWCNWKKKQGLFERKMLEKDTYDWNWRKKCGGEKAVWSWYHSDMKLREGRIVLLFADELCLPE